MRSDARVWMAWMVVGALGCKAAPGGGDESSSGSDTGGQTGSSTSGDDSSTGDTTGPGPTTTPEPTTGSETTQSPTGPGETTDGDSTGTSSGSESSGTTGEMPVGPMVDVSDPQLYEFEFKPDAVDPEAKLALGNEHAQLDTTVTPLGKLVVYLHGAGAPGTCGSKTHGKLLAGLGFHVVHPCYVSDYGVGNCGDDIGGCRLEAFEGVDHHPFIDIKPPDSIEVRVVKMLEHLQAENPAGDWQYFIVDGEPRWSDIIVSGISHGASTSGLIGMVRSVHRSVMLSGPLDSNQAWLGLDPVTPIDRFYGFTHTGDEQHPGHLVSFADMMLPGEPAVVDGAAPPYGGSHRLVSSAPTGDGHGSTQAGGSSPKDGDDYLFMPVWRTMYGVQP